MRQRKNKAIATILNILVMHVYIAITVEGKNGRRDIERVTKKIGYWLLGSWALISQQLTGFFTVIHSIPRE